MGGRNAALRRFHQDIMLWIEERNNALRMKAERRA